MPYHLYRCFGPDDALFYVGSTSNLFGRLKAHQRSWWSSQVVRVTARVAGDQVTARRLERTAIINEVPRYNIQHRWAGVPRDHWVMDDYFHYSVAVLMETNDPVLAFGRVSAASAEAAFRFGYGLDMATLRAVRAARDGAVSEDHVAAVAS